MLRAAFAVYLSVTLVGCFAKQELSRQAVVNVDGKQLSAREFADQLAERLKSFDALSAKDPNVVSATKRGIVRDFIASAITERWAKENQVFVRKEQLDEEVAKIRKMYPDENSFRAMLADNKLDPKVWQERLQSSLLQKLVARKLSETIAEPTETEIRDHFNRNKENYERPEQARLRQIVLANESDARIVAAELKKGAKFDELARERSLTPEGKARGGALGWIDKGTLEVFDQAFSLKPGQRTDVLKSPYGHHIIELMQKRSAGLRPFDEVRKEIAAQIKANREQSAYTSWLEAQIRKARVLVNQQMIGSIKIETRGDE